MSFRRLLERGPSRRVHLTVYAGDESDLLEGIDFRNATVERRRLPPDDADGFVVVHDEDEFVAAVGPAELARLVEPAVHDPWSAALGREYRRLYELFRGTVFESLERRQLLGATREVEHRAWTVGNGTLRVGFQRRAAFDDQLPVYARLAAETDLAVHVYGAWDRDPPAVDGLSYHRGNSDEIGSFWFLAFDGGDGERAGGLLAEERSPGTYAGFWTFDRTLVEELSTAAVEAASAAE